MHKEKQYLGYIYMWYNKETKKPYIGKTNNKECRYNWFIQWDLHYAGPHIDKARKKYNDIKFWDYKILYETSNTDKIKLRDDLDEHEKYFIRLYESNNKNKGYNISSGGTWGDTFSSLTEKERKERLEKQSSTTKKMGYKWMNDGINTKKVSIYDQQQYLDNGWEFGYGKERMKINRKAIDKYCNSEKMKKQKEETKLRQKQRKIERDIEKQKEREIRNQTTEWQEHLKENSEKHRNIIIEYNKSEKHKKDAIESNKRRWKDGVPEETLNKMRNAQRKYWDSIETKIWIKKDGKSKMIEPKDLDYYISLGYEKGRATKPWNKGIKTNKPAWNKGIKISNKNNE